jgi:choline dehydrogenase-like flavoprotein
MNVILVWLFMKWERPVGNDPKDSVLNKWNQMHEVSNVFVTDGSCMPLLLVKTLL